MACEQELPLDKQIKPKPNHQTNILEDLLTKVSKEVEELIACPTEKRAIKKVRLELYKSVILVMAATRIGILKSKNKADRLKYCELFVENVMNPKVLDLLLSPPPNKNNGIPANGAPSKNTYWNP